MSAQRSSWTPEESAALEEARRKLNRSMRINAAIAIAGVVITVGSLVAGQGGFILAYGAIIAGPLLAYQAQRRLRKLDTLQPGTTLNASVLGVRTSLDPPAPSQKKGLIIVSILLGIVILGILVMVLVLK